MKTLGVLVIVIVTIIGILLMTALASQMIVPLQKAQPEHHTSSKHKESPRTSPCPWPGGCQKGQDLSPADIDDGYTEMNRGVTGDAYSDKWDAPDHHPIAREPSPQGPSSGHSSTPHPKPDPGPSPPAHLIGPGGQRRLWGPGGQHKTQVIPSHDSSTTDFTAKHASRSRLTQHDR